MCPISVTDTSIHLDPQIRQRRAARTICCRRCCRATSPTMWKGTQFMTETRRRLRRRPRSKPSRAARRGTWRLYGDKWFCSHADADVALLLARPEGAPAGTRGLALFALPRRLEGWHAATAYRIVRLKDKLGTRSMALGRDPAGGRGRLSGRPGRPRPQADDGAGQPVAAVARRARCRHDAALRQRGADRARATASRSASPSSSIRCCAASC